MFFLQNGEDVRQDQLAVHMVSLMDRQLKEAGLDLRLKVCMNRIESNRTNQAGRGEARRGLLRVWFLHASGTI